MKGVETIDAVNGSQDVMYQLVMPFEDRKSLSHCPGDCINQSSSLKYKNVIMSYSVSGHTTAWHVKLHYK